MSLLSRNSKEEINGDCFVYSGLSSHQLFYPNKHIKVDHNGPPTKRRLNGVLLVGR